MRCKRFYEIAEGIDLRVVENPDKTLVRLELASDEAMGDDVFHACLLQYLKKHIHEDILHMDDEFECG